MLGMTALNADLHGQIIMVRPIWSDPHGQIIMVSSIVYHGAAVLSL